MSETLWIALGAVAVGVVIFSLVLYAAIRKKRNTTA